MGTGRPGLRRTASVGTGRQADRAAPEVGAHNGEYAIVIRHCPFCGTALEDDVHSATHSTS